jgi:scyllo-inositol 2-dehydrogenase (NADP+)
MTGIGTAVVGCGRAGRAFHAYLVRLTPGLRLHGIVSGDPAKRARIPDEQGCRAYASLDEALADDAVRLVILATPHDTHAPLAIRAMDAGRHVVTDKVMCLNLVECDAMIAAACRNRVLLSVFQNRRFDGDFLTVRRLIADGALGEVKWVEMAWQGFGPSRGWRNEAARGGGKLYDLGAHLIDQACLFFPQAIEHVYARLHHDFRPETDIPSEALLVIAFRGGGTAVVDCSSLAALPKPRFYIHGRRATFRKFGVDPQEAAMMAGDIDAAREDPAAFGVLRDDAGERAVPTLPGRWRDYYENVAAALDGRAPLAVTPESVRRQIAVLDAARRSAETGRTATVDG